jgi:predicted DNA-binding ribbon-helix-helix protein
MRGIARAPPAASKASVVAMERRAGGHSPAAAPAWGEFGHVTSFLSAVAGVGCVISATPRTFRENVSVKNQFCGCLSQFHFRGSCDMKNSMVIKRSIVVGGHKTSVSLEDNFWEALKEIAHGHRVTLSALVGSIDSQREHGNLSSVLRLFVLNHYR